MKLLPFPHTTPTLHGIDLAHQHAPGASRINVEYLERERYWREFLRMVEETRGPVTAWPRGDGPRAA